MAFSDSASGSAAGVNVTVPCRPVNPTSRDGATTGVNFAQELEEPAFAPREFLAGRDAHQLARDLLGMTQEEFSAAFKESPMRSRR